MTPTPRPLTAAEPFSAKQIDQWRAAVADRQVDPELPWPDKDVIVLVARFLATLDRDRASAGAGLDVELLATALYVIDRTRSSGAYPHLGRDIGMVARDIAAEYARLAAALSPDKRPETGEKRVKP